MDGAVVDVLGTESGFLDPHLTAGVFQVDHAVLKPNCSMQDAAMSHTISSGVF